MGRAFDRIEELERRVAEIEREVHWGRVLLWSTLALSGLAAAVALWGHG